VVCGEVSDEGWRKLSSLVARPFSVPMPMGSPAGQACFACRVLDFVIIPDVICGSIAVCHHRSRLRSRTTVGGEPGCLDGSRCRVSRQVVSEEGQLSTASMWHRSTIGHEYPSSFEGGNSRDATQPCVPKAADFSPGTFERPGSGGNPGAEVAKTFLTEQKPTEARAPNGFAGGNSQRLVHPVCAEGGGRFAGCVRGAMFWGQLRSGSHEGGPDGAETDGSAHTDWVRGGQLPRARSNPLVFERRLLIPGVHERFGEGNPEELFNDRRFGFGRAEGRPARFGGEARSLPNGFGRRALCDERDEGG